MDPLLAVAWWAPLAIIGGALVGVGVGYLLLAFTETSRSRRSATPEQLRYGRTDKTNYPSWNPLAFLAIGGVIALIVGLAVGLSVG